MVNLKGYNRPILRQARRQVTVVLIGGGVVALVGLTPRVMAGQAAQSSRPQSSASHPSAVQPPASINFPNVIPWATDLGPANAMYGPLDPRKSQAEMLTARDDVRRELDLNARQQEQLAALVEQTTKNLQAVPHKAVADGGLLRGDASPFHLVIDQNGQVSGSADDGADTPAVRAAAATMQQALVQARLEADKQRDVILTPAQAMRLKQLEAQWRGPFLLLPDASGADETRDKIKLSDAQEDRLKAVWEQLHTRMVQNEQALAPQAAIYIRDYDHEAHKQDGFLALAHQLWREDHKTRAFMEKQALAILTPAQKRQWAATVGKPFAFRSDAAAFPELFGQYLPR